MNGNSLFDKTREILGVLFDREIAHTTQLEKALIDQHIALGGSKDGFRYMGAVHTNLAGAARCRGHYDRLHPSLHAKMSSIQTSKKAVEAERARIQQALTLVLRDAHTDQDVRDALPNCLQGLIPSIRGLQRGREEAFTLRDNPRAYSQYMLIRDKIEFYVAAQLLY